MFCSKCGAPAVSDASFCAKCGAGFLSHPIQEQPKTIPAIDSSSAPTHVRPWARLWARLFDVYTFTLVGLAVISNLVPQINEKLNDWVLILTLCFMWVFVESFLLSVLQVTPGKWLFKIKIALSSGASINYSQALSRSLKVWWRGLGAGFPIAAIITMVIASLRLTKNGITSWDKDDGFLVSHEKIGMLRVLVAIGIVVTLLVTFSMVVPPECASISDYERFILKEKCRG